MPAQNSHHAREAKRREGKKIKFNSMFGKMFTLDVCLKAYTMVCSLKKFLFESRDGGNSREVASAQPMRTCYRFEFLIGPIKRRVYRGERLREYY